MAIPLYLAKTAAEFACSTNEIGPVAWMACHFSPYSTGITNLPKTLPEGSLLILNDRTPVSGHDPELVSSMLFETFQQFKCSGILLDLQRQNCPETAAIAKEIAALPCPVAVSEHYAGKLQCDVFLCAPAPYIPLERYIAPWSGRRLWLETALVLGTVTVTETGCRFEVLHNPADTDYPFLDETLHCRYRTNVKDDRICFTLYRGKNELNTLLKDAERLGIKCAIGLFQELGK